MNRAAEAPSPAWALEVLNKNLIDDLSDPEQTTLNFNRARMESTRAYSFQNEQHTYFSLPPLEDEEGTNMGRWGGGGGRGAG